MTSDGSVNVSALLEEDPEMRLDDLPETGVGGDGDGDGDASGSGGTGATETDAETTTAARARERLAERLREAGLSTRRFIDVADASKASHDHNQREPDDPRLLGNYGVYAGPGADGNDTDAWLVDVDVDDYAAAADSTDALVALEALPATLTTETPHTDGETGGHRFYAVEGDVVAAIQDVTDGTSNPSPSWGEIRVANQYVVGPGSQIDECEKEWCDECATPDGGRYRIAADRPIASITATELADVLRFDPNYSIATGGRVDAETGAHTDTALHSAAEGGSGGVTPTPNAAKTDLADDELVEKAKNAENGDRFAALWRGDTSGHESPSEADLALVSHLAFWSGGDRQQIDRLFRESGLYREKWNRDDYRKRTMNKALAGRTEFYEPGGGPDAPATDAGVGVASGNGMEAPADPWTEVLGLYRDPETATMHANARAAKVLLEERPAITERETGAILVYDPDGGTYHRHGTSILRRILVEKLDTEYSDSRRREIFEHIRGRTERPVEEIGGREGLVCVSNGVLDLRGTPDGEEDVADAAEIKNRIELLDFDPEYGFMRSLPVKYDPEADAPRWRAFVDEVTRGNGHEILQEYVGYCLMHWGQSFKRAVMILGPKDSGKSTFLNVAIKLFGRPNVSAENLNSLVNTRWGAAELQHRFVNITNELDTAKLESLSKFKTVVGGDGQLSAERKGQDKFDFEPTAKHMFAANRVPPTDDADDAFHDRWLHVVFPRTIPKHEQERGLKESLFEELPGILNWAIEGHVRLREQSGFSHDPLVGRKRELWEAYGNSVQRFKQRCLEVTGDTDDTIVKDVAYAGYVAHSEQSDLEVKSDGEFKRELKRQKNVDDARRTIRTGGKQRYVFTGVKWSPDALAALDFDPGAELDRIRPKEAEADGEDIERRGAESAVLDSYTVPARTGGEE